MDDPFLALARPGAVDDGGFERLRHLPRRPVPGLGPVPAVGRLHGFDLLERPVVGGFAAAPGAALPARTTVPLRRAMVGREVLVLFEGGELDRPIIVGVLEPVPLADEAVAEATPGEVRVGVERRVIEAEREIVLRCGEASITLTRAGKVVIRGAYILSRSTGCNKIKGAAVDIN